jgi:5-deoxy-glucuronate isomerase
MTLTTLVTPESAGWAFGGLAILDLPPDGAADVETRGSEMLVLPLSGGPATVECDGTVVQLEGRPSVFARVTDFGYVPRDASVTVRAPRGGVYALPSARCDRRLEPCYGKAEEVPVELRGAGPASRQVNNFCAPDAFDTARLTAVEVLTPGGNWSSYPPHKHDTEAAGEAILEEIYYFLIRDGVADPATEGRASGRSPGGAGSQGDDSVGRGAKPQPETGGYPRGGAPRGMGYQRVYGSPGKPIDVLREVRSGDVVLVPHGYHGPSMAAPGYDMYYLNVLAGPADQRTMAFRDDPCHAWVRASWAVQELDPRLPMTTHLGVGGAPKADPRARTTIQKHSEGA